MVAEGAASSGLTPGRTQWHIGRDVFVAETNELAGDRAVLGRNYLQHQLPNAKGSGMLASTKVDPKKPE